MANAIVPKEEHTDVFDVLYEQWRRIKNPATKQKISKVLLQAKLRRPEINKIREQRHIQRLMAEQRDNINGNLVTGELHELEYAACEILCSALKHGSGTALKEGWRWVMRQPWGREFSASPIEKRHNNV